MLKHGTQQSTMKQQQSNHHTDPPYCDEESDFCMIFSNRHAVANAITGHSNEFTVALPTPIKLVGNWCVALTNILYTAGQFVSSHEDRHNWKITVLSPYKPLNKAFATTDITYAVELDRVEVARCKKVKTLCDVIQQTIKNKLCKGDEALSKEIFSLEAYNTTNAALKTEKGQENTTTNTLYTINVDDKFTVYLPRLLGDILHCRSISDLVESRGVHAPDATLTITHETLFAIPPFVLESELALAFLHTKTNNNKPVDNMLVMCDIVQDSSSPDLPLKMQPVLASLPASPHQHRLDLETPRYKRIVKSEFGSIRFWFSGDQGQQNVVNFKQNISCQLHFKPIVKEARSKRFAPY